MQLEKVINLYKFADFGRLTAGLFHDIANPLTQVSLNLSNIKYQTNNNLFHNLKKITPVIKRAISGTKQMEKMVLSVRKQIQQQETKNIYNPLREIEMVVENFEYKCKKMGVKIEVNGERKIHTFGNSLRFYQLVSNLISNSIDAYYDIKREENRKIIVELDIEENEIVLIVKDFGCGIDEEHVNKIFDPLFTTKCLERGSGIGLYISKEIVEKEFNGTIEVKSKLKEGTNFMVKFPIKKKTEE